ncbi:MAG: hypothetical protein EOO77_42305, partial [Oxalobacteraceae bacterium]
MNDVATPIATGAYPRLPHGTRAHFVLRRGPLGDRIRACPDSNEERTVGAVAMDFRDTQASDMSTDTIEDPATARAAAASTGPVLLDSKSVTPQPYP